MTETMRTTVLAILASALLAASRICAAADISTGFPQGDAYQGVPYAVVIQVEGARDVSPPEAPEIAGASVRVSERSRQTSMQIVNGRVTRSMTVVFVLEVTPDRPGPIEIPSVTVRADGGELRTEARTVAVLPNDAGGLLTAEVYGQPPEVMIGEPLDLVLRIGIKAYRDPAFGELNELQMWQLVDVKNSEWGVFEPELAELLQRGSAPRTQRELRDGEQWFTYEIARRTWPPKAGLPDIGSVMVRMTYPLELREVQGFAFSRELRMTRARPVAAAAEPAGIQVLPLPEDGRPASFSGAVGTYSIETTAKPTSVGVGDPITLTLVITDRSGTANMESLQPPALAADAALARDFKVPNEAISGVVGGRSKRFTLTLRPLRAGIESIPPIEFSSYDPKARAYATVRSQPIPVTVVPGSQLDLSKIVSAGGPPGAAEPADSLTSAEGGLVANKPVSPALLDDDRPALGGLAIAALALPPVAGFAALAWRAHRSRHERDGSLARRSRARREAERRLARAADAAAVAGALSGFVEDSIGRAPGTLTRGDLDAALAAAGVEDELRSCVRDLLGRCDRARYAGAGAGGSPALADEARSLVARLDGAGLRAKGGGK